MQVISFAMMLFLTLIAFFAVYQEFSGWYIMPVIVLLAVVQVIFQLYYFMHMNHKGHTIPAFFLVFRRIGSSFNHFSFCNHYLVVKKELACASPFHHL